MDDQFALRIKLGDEQAFELFFRKYYVRLCGFANKFLNNPEESREVVQEVFIKIWEVRKDIDPGDSFKGYLFKITQNLSLNKLSRRKVESKYIEICKFVYIEPKEFTPYETLISYELDNTITSAISRIPPKCRRIFELSRVEGLKYGEIAETLQISVKTVEAQMSKALQILRLELREYLDVLILLLISETLFYLL